MTDPWDSVLNRVEAIKSDDSITKADKDTLLELHRRLKRAGMGEHRHRDLLGYNHRLARAVDDISVGFEDPQKADEVVDYIRGTYDGWTSKDYRIGYRQFAEYCCDGDRKPRHIEEISAGAKGVEPRPSKSEYITQDEAKRMIQSRMNPRDKALIALLYEAGPRGGEVYDMTYGDIWTEDGKMKVRFFGKTKKQRTVFVHWAKPWISRWLTEYPGETSDDAPLWCRLQASNQGGVGEKISKSAMYKFLHDAAEKAGVDKDPTPTNFRKSNAYYLSQFPQMNVRDINVRQGRKPESDEIRPYLNVDGTDADANYRAGLGLEEPGDSLDPEELTPVHCSICNRESPEGSEMCQWCGNPFTEEAREAVDSAEVEFVQLIREDPEIAQDAATLLQRIKEDTELRADVASGGPTAQD